MHEHLAGSLMTVCYTICYFPQIYKTLKTKQAKDLSVEWIALSLCGHIFGITYASFGVNNIWLYVSYLSGIFCTSTLLILCKKYG
jgi:uncharacterized protein with PQ loop repeat